MVVSLDNIPKESQVYRFITSGKPGRCEMPSHKGLRLVDKLEIHHLSYDPEITIKLCHFCHHKIHFWPQRLEEADKLKLLIKRFNSKSAVEIVKNKLINSKTISRLLAPSRKVFLDKEQMQGGYVRKKAKRKVNKAVNLDFVKRIGL